MDPKKEKEKDEAQVIDDEITLLDMPTKQELDLEKGRSLPPPVQIDIDDIDHDC